MAIPCVADMPGRTTRAPASSHSLGQRTHRTQAACPDPAGAQAGHAAAARAASLGGRPPPLERPHSGSGAAGSYGGMPTRFTVTTGETFALPPPPCAPGPSPPAAASVQVRDCTRAGPAAAAERGGMLRSRCCVHMGWVGGCLYREHAGDALLTVPSWVALSGERSGRAACIPRTFMLAPDTMAICEHRQYASSARRQRRSARG